MWIGHRKEIRKRTFRAQALRRSGIRSHEGLALEMSASEISGYLTADSARVRPAKCNEWTLRDITNRFRTRFLGLDSSRLFNFFKFNFLVHTECFFSAICMDYWAAFTKVRQARWMKPEVTYSKPREDWCGLNITLLTIPTGWRQTSWLFTSVPARIWNWGYQETNPKVVVRSGLKPGTAGLRVRHADHSTTVPPCYRIAGLQNC